MKTVIKWIDMLNKAVGVIVTIMLAVMSLLILMQVISRFAIEHPYAWTEELARYLMIYSVFLGAALALRQHKMIAVEIIAESLKPKARKMMKIGIMILTVVFLIILLKQGLNMLPIVSRQSSSALGWSMDKAYMAIPIGAALMIINAIAVIFEFLTKEHVETSETAEIMNELKKGEEL